MLPKEAEQNLSKHLKEAYAHFCDTRYDNKYLGDLAFKYKTTYGLTEKTAFETIERARKEQFLEELETQLKEDGWDNNDTVS